MRLGVASLAVTLGLAASAAAITAKAAQPRSMSEDLSGSFLIDSATAEKLWKENTPANISRLYPVKKFRFVSEVGGGFNEAKSCVVSARAMLLPVVHLPVQGAKVIYSPIKSATTFDAVPDLSREQCQALAHSKLKDAIQSLASSLSAG